MPILRDIPQPSVPTPLFSIFRGYLSNHKAWSIKALPNIYRRQILLHLPKYMFKVQFLEPYGKIRYPIMYGYLFKLFFYKIRTTTFSTWYCVKSCSFSSVETNFNISTYLEVLSRNVLTKQSSKSKSNKQT